MPFAKACFIITIFSWGLARAPMTNGWLTRWLAGWLANAVKVAHDTAIQLLGQVQVFSQSWLNIYRWVFQGWLSLSLSGHGETSCWSYTDPAEISWPCPTSMNTKWGGGLLESGSGSGSGFFWHYVLLCSHLGPISRLLHLHAPPVAGKG